MISGAFSIHQFANDTAGLLDALNIEKADVFGFSLGSHVAQQLADYAYRKNKQAHSCEHRVVEKRVFLQVLKF